MHPVLSATVFSVLSAAGLGLLAWLGISIVLLHARADLAAALHALQVGALLLGTALAATMFAPAPGRDVRPVFSGWRTRWAPRANLLGAATLAVAAALLATLGWIAPSGDRAMALGLLGLLLALSALSTAAATAMAHSTHAPAPDHPLLLPMHLLFALALGLGLLFLLMARLLPFGTGDGGMLVTLAVLGTLLAACLLLYWRAPHGHAPHGHDPHGHAPRPPHAVARRPRLRRGSLVLVFAVPLACALLAQVQVQALAAMPWLALAVLSLLGGAMLERWLFFVQPRRA